MSKLNQQFRLPDGRKLGFDEYGLPGGKPVFYFHGSPSSRIEFALFGDDALARSLNVRLIVADRPGMGLSDFQPARSLLDWPQDVLALADSMGVERFAILAYSLGGPYGMACAYAIPERLNKVSIVSGAALFSNTKMLEKVNPGTRRYLYLPRKNPFAARLFLLMMDATTRFAPKLMTANAASLLPECDREIVADPEIQKGFITMLREALRQGRRGVFHDSLLSVTDMGFRLQDIHTPVLVYHGELDKNIPVEMARYIAAVVPQSEAVFYPDEGHLSLIKKNIEGILRILAE